MKLNEFEEMFFNVIKKWDVYSTQVIRNKMILNNKYKNELHNTCELIAFRNHISVHDALHSYLSNGEIRRVKNEYSTTGKI